MADAAAHTRTRRTVDGDGDCLPSQMLHHSHIDMVETGEEQIVNIQDPQCKAEFLAVIQTQTVDHESLKNSGFFYVIFHIRFLTLFFINKSGFLRFAIEMFTRSFVTTRALFGFILQIRRMRSSTVCLSSPRHDQAVLGCSSNSSLRGTVWSAQLRPILHNF